MAKTKESVNRITKELNGDTPQAVTITPPNFKTARFNIVGDAPLVIHAFSQKAINQIREKQEAGSVAKKGKKRDPKDFEANFQASRHLSTEGWDGIPASAFRNGMISACRTVGFRMTLAKLSVFVVADGFEANGTPLVRIVKGEPHKHESYVRNETGVVDLRARAMFDPGWEAVVRIKFDADQFTVTDVANLLMRVGMQGGLGDGRPDSKNSAGMGWGTFTLKEDQ